MKKKKLGLKQNMSKFKTVDKESIDKIYLLKRWMLLRTNFVVYTGMREKEAN